MTFVHDDPEFDALLRVTAEQRRIAVALVEKDYWVTHCLWALHAQGFELWFKGGTSLSKGFGLIERFSEDLDLMLEPGRVSTVSAITNWKSDNKGPFEARKAHYQTLAAALKVPGVTTVEVDPTSAELKWRGARLEVHYPGLHRDELASVLSPFVLLEIGRARVAPWVVSESFPLACHPCVKASFGGRAVAGPQCSANGEDFAKDGLPFRWRTGAFELLLEPPHEAVEGGRRGAV